MKLDPGFPNHWKTERLRDQLGSDGVVAILRLWGNAQIRRKFSGLELSPKRLAMETKWTGDADHLFTVLTDPDAPWLDKEPDGTFTIHGFEEHQHQVVKLWENGRKGGRPRKVSPKPSSTSSSSSPICEPNENQMVFEGVQPSKSPKSSMGENTAKDDSDSSEGQILPKGWKKMTATQMSQTRVVRNSSMMVQIGAAFDRKKTCLWTVGEAAALLQIKPTPEEIEQILEYYTVEIPTEQDYRRRKLITLLNNWNAELDSASVWKTTQHRSA